jgi:long-chain acyl-CoA synthetase
VPGRPRSSSLSDVHDLTTATDPVAVFRAAHRRHEPVAVHTAGSTRTPRRVLRTTASWVASFAAVSDLCGLGDGARVWVPGPPTGSMNVFARVHAGWVGATLVGSPSAASHVVVTPSALADLLPTAHAGLVAVVAGDTLSPASTSRAREAGVEVHHYYGAAELSFVAWGRDAASLRPFPGVDVEVRDGEVWVRSPYLCLGYDEATPGPLRRDPAGWATVGDRGELVDGVLDLHGRPDAVTTGGATVCAAEVEAVLRRHARGDVVVVGVPHDRLGAVVAAILTDPGDHARLVAVARAELAEAARPRRWWLVDALPLTAAGKVDRVLLADRAPTLRPVTRSTVVP